MPPPKESVTTAEYRITEGPVEKTGHTTFVAKYKAKEKPNIKLFGKLCADSYPSSLALWNVSISEMARACIGDRAAKDELIINEYNEIIGTISKETDFVPLLEKGEPDHKDPEKHRLANPDLETILEEDYAEIAAINYVLGNDDLKGANASLKIALDFDMCCYGATSNLKGPRILCTLKALGPPEKTSEIKGAELQKYGLETQRCYWVGQDPKNWFLIYPKKVKSEAFKKLKTNAVYQKQFFNAILKIMLAFDKSTMRKRLELPLGKEKLDLDSLPQYKREKYLEYCKKDQLLHSKNGKKLVFIDHICKYFDLRIFKVLEKALIEEVPRFHEHLVYLRQNPLMLDPIFDWFKENHQDRFPIPSGKIQKKFSDLWHNIFKPGTDDGRLQKLWRQVFRPKLETYLSSETTISTARYEPHLKFMKPNEIVMVFKNDQLTAYWLLNGEKKQKTLPKSKVEDILKMLPASGKSTQDIGVAVNISERFSTTHIKSLQQITQRLIDSGPDTIVEVQDYQTKEEAIDLNESVILKIDHIKKKKKHSCGFKDLRKLLKKLTFNIDIEIAKYYETSDPTQEQNHNFIETIEKLLEKSVKDFEKIKNYYLTTEKFSSVLRETGNDIILNSIFEDFYKLTKNLKNEFKSFRFEPLPVLSEDLEEELEEEEEDYIDVELTEKEIELSRYTADSKDDRDSIAKDLANKLKQWVDAAKGQELAQVIQEVNIASSAPSGCPLIGWALSRFRSPPPLIEPPKSTLPEVFSERNWSKTSLSTQVIKKICLMALKKDAEDIHRIIQSRSDDWWASISEKIAEYSGLHKKTRALILD